MTLHPRKNRSKALRRQVARRPELRTIVIFCEGKNSEPDYLKGIKKIPEIAASTSLNIEIDPEQGVPLTLVKMASERITNPEVDECWCLFDVEWPKHHPNLRKAVALAEARGVKLAISNPCFEIWLLLHFTYYTRFLSTAEAEKLSKACDGRSGKSLDADAYMSARAKACKHASALDKRHIKNRTSFPNNNPSSGMHQLIASLEAACAPTAREPATGSPETRRSRK